MNAKIYCVLAVFLIGINFTIAQSTQSQLLENISISSNNSADIIQIGNNNEAFIQQIRESEIKGNVSKITQYNEYNTASINQSGIGNQNIITQSGINNKTTTDVNGNFNSSVIIQDGNNNYVEQKLESDYKNYYFAQQGFNNLIVQQGSEVVSKPYLVFQKGSGMRLFITSSAVK